MRRSLNPLRSNNEGGYIMLMALVVVGLVSIMSLSISDNAWVLLNQQKNMSLETVSANIQKKILSTIYNNEAWNNFTAVGNACQRTGVGCPLNPGPQVFLLRDSSGAIVNDSLSAGFGYTERGSICGSYNDAGNDSCPFQYQLTWEPVNCTPAPCDIEIVGRLSYRPSGVKRVGLINLNNYFFRVIRGREQDSMQEACVSLTGVFDQSLNGCIVQNPVTECPPGQFLVQASILNQPSCRPLLGFGTQCPTGSAAVGVLPGGSLDCRSNLDWK